MVKTVFYPVTIQIRSQCKTGLCSKCTKDKWGFINRTQEDDARESYQQGILKMGTILVKTPPATCLQKARQFALMGKTRDSREADL